VERLYTFGGNEELLNTFNSARVRFIVVGGLAVRFHVPERQAAEDLDLLIESSIENADRIFEALGALKVTPTFEKSAIAAPGPRPQQMMLKGRYPFYADILTCGQAIDFSAEWRQSHEGMIGFSKVRFASRELLIEMKNRTIRKTEQEREKDRSDIRLLKGINSSE
jgi:hypothetical protein